MPDICRRTQPPRPRRGKVQHVEPTWPLTLPRKHVSLVIEGLPFGARMAQMLVRISLDLRLTKHCFVAASIPAEETGLSAAVRQAGMVRRTARWRRFRPSSTHGAPSALAARYWSGCTSVASTRTALSPNRGPNSRSIDNRTPAVARREDEIDASTVRASLPAR